MGVYEATSVVLIDPFYEITFISVIRCCVGTTDGILGTIERPSVKVNKINTSSYYSNKSVV